MSFWTQKIVVVTGGTQGLGKEITLAFAEAGATVVAIARNTKRNEEFVQEHTNGVLKIESLTVDVSDDDSVSSAIAEIKSRHGKIDVWVNNVGVSIRADIRATGLEEYKRLMELNFYTAVRCSTAVMDELDSASGHLVNIGSLSSKTAWPFMAPYSASKSALASYTHQLRIEGPSNVHFLLVCPGPIQRADSGQRYKGQTDGLDDSANQPGGGAKLKGLDPKWLAQKIVAACQNRKTELVIPWKSRLLFSIAQLFPRIGDWLLRRFKK